MVLANARVMGLIPMGDHDENICASYCKLLWITASTEKSLIARPFQFSHRNKMHLQCILNKNINTTCKVLVPCFMRRNKRSQKCSICTKSLFCSNFVHKFVYIPVSDHFSFAKIIHQPDRCGISISW